MEYDNIPGPDNTAAGPNQPGGPNPFSDPDIDMQIQAKLLNLRAANIEWDENQTGSLEDHWLATWELTLDAHAEAYLPKVDRMERLQQYRMYIRCVGSRLTRQAEEWFLSNPYTADRSRKLIMQSSDFQLKKDSLTDAQLEQYVRRRIADDRNRDQEEREKTFKLISRRRLALDSRLEARYLRWQAAALDQIRNLSHPVIVAHEFVRGSSDSGREVVSEEYFRRLVVEALGIPEDQISPDQWLQAQLAMARRYGHFSIDPPTKGAARPPLRPLAEEAITRGATSAAGPPNLISKSLANCRDADDEAEADLRPAQESAAEDEVGPPERRPVAYLGANANARLKEVILRGLSSLARRFKDYAEEFQPNLGTDSWARPQDGHSERYLDCFAPLIETVVAEYVKYCSDTPDAIAASCFKRLQSECDTSYRLSETSQYPLSPTDPWQSGEIFALPEFEAGLLGMIENQVRALTVDGLHTAICGEGESSLEDRVNNDDATLGADAEIPATSERLSNIGKCAAPVGQPSEAGDLINLSPRQQAILLEIVDGDLAHGGDEFYFTDIGQTGGVWYLVDAAKKVAADRSDILQLAGAGMLTVRQTKQYVFRGKPTQQGIQTATAIRERKSHEAPRNEGGPELSAKKSEAKSGTRDFRLGTPSPSGGERPNELSERDREVHKSIGESNFRTLRNREILKSTGLGLRKKYDLQSGTDAAKSCLDRIRRHFGYPLSRDIEKKRSAGQPDNGQKRSKHH